MEQEISRGLRGKYRPYQGGCHAVSMRLTVFCVRLPLFCSESKVVVSSDSTIVRDKCTGFIM